MNCIDYLFAGEIQNEKELFVLGARESLSFFDLKKQVALLSKTLKACIGVGNNVLLISPNSNFFIVCYLAIMKSGNVVIPLNPVTEEDTRNNFV